MLPCIVRLDGPTIPPVRRMQNDSLVPLVPDDPALLSDELYGPEEAPGKPFPRTSLSPPLPCDEEEDGEGEIKANIKAEPPAGFPLSGWARMGCGQAFSPLY